MAPWIGAAALVIFLSFFFALDIYRWRQRRRADEAERQAEHVDEPAINFAEALHPVGGWRATLPIQTVEVEVPEGQPRLPL